MTKKNDIESHPNELKQHNQTNIGKIFILSIIVILGSLHYFGTSGMRDIQKLEKRCIDRVSTNTSLNEAAKEKLIKKCDYSFHGENETQGTYTKALQREYISKIKKSYAPELLYVEYGSDVKVLIRQTSETTKTGSQKVITLNGKIFAVDSLTRILPVDIHSMDEITPVRIEITDQGNNNEVASKFCTIAGKGHWLEDSFVVSVNLFACYDSSKNKILTDDLRNIAVCSPESYATECLEIKGLRAGKI